MITINIHWSFFLIWFQIALKPNLPFVVYGLFGLRVTHGPWIIVHSIIMDSFLSIYEFWKFCTLQSYLHYNIICCVIICIKEYKEIIWSKSHILNSIVYTWAMMCPRTWPSTLCHKMKFVFNLNTWATRLSQSIVFF
jgi:hypothetical protein